jgi:hypothetical protein
MVVCAAQVILLGIMELALEIPAAPPPWAQG